MTDCAKGGVTVAESTEVLERGADEMKTALDAAKYGQVEVTGITAKVTRDSEDALSIILYVTLKDPAGESWPFSDVLKLRHEVWRQADRIGLQVPVFIRLRPEHDQPQEDDDPRLFP
jgi:hypothetical protein